MKNRVLSVLLSIGIVLSNCSSGFVAIAEGDNTVPKETTTVEETTIEETTTEPTNPSEPPALDNPSVGDEEDEPNVEPSTTPDNEPIEDENVVISVSKIKDLTIYNGQSLDDIYKIYNDNLKEGNNAGKPRYVDYFTLTSSDGNALTNEMYNAIEVKFEQVTEDVTADEIIYSLHFAFKNDEFKDTYRIKCDNEYRFTVNNNYSPSDDIKVESITGDDYKVYLQCKTDGYSIGSSADETSFTKEPILLSSLKDGVYYLRNTKEDNIYFNAISMAISYTHDSKAEVSPNAVVSGIDFSNTTAYNKNVTVTITAYAVDNTIRLSLWNNGDECLVDQEIKPNGNVNGKNEFTTKYTFEAPESGVLHITNLKAKISGVNTEWPLELTDGKNKCQDFVIDTINPIINCENEWSEGWSGYGPECEVFQFTVEEKESSIASLEYSFDNNNWEPLEYSNLNEIKLSIPYSKAEKPIVYVRAIDKAGNIGNIERTKEGVWISDSTVSDTDINDVISEIEGIELYYSQPTANGQFDVEVANPIKVTSDDVFHSAYSGNAINKPLQLRIMSDESNTICINGSELSKHYTMITIGNDAGISTTKTFDYFYYNMPIGYDGDIKISLNDKKIKIPFKSTVVSEYLGFEVLSNHIKIEADTPAVQLDNPKFASENVAVDNKWYGIKEENGTFNIHIDDKNDGSGIRSIKIENNGSVISATAEHPIIVSPENGNTSNIISTLTTQNFDSSIKKITKVDVSIPLELFSDGDHVLKITVVDNAGNTQTGFTSIEYDDNSPDINTLEFSTDFTAPKGTITLESLSTIIPDKNGIAKDWFDADDIVSFKFTIDDSDFNNNSNPYKVVWTANQQHLDVTRFFTDGNTELIAESTDSNAALGENHDYNINATFYDQAGNANEDGSVETLTFYKDTDNPKIETVSVSRAPETGLGKVLRIISFGIFSNDNVIVSVKAHDSEYDSGLNDKSLEISLNSGKSYTEMEQDRDMYKYRIPVSEIPLSGTIAIRVTDNFGHRSEDFTEIIADNGTVGDEKTESKDFVIEEIAPNVTIMIPESDGIARTDGQTWYNSEKDIIINADDEGSGIYSVTVQVNGVKIERDSRNNNFNDNFSSKIDNDVHTYHLSTEGLREVLGNANQIPDDGHYVITVSVEDNAGNIREESVDYFLDYDAPVVQKIDFSVPSADGDVDVSQFITELEYGFYFKAALIATANVTDKVPSSGLHRIEYVLVEYSNGEKRKEYPGTAEINSDGKATFDIPANFKGQILVKAFDYVENESEEVTPELFVVDTPERHESEDHIEITGMGQTGFTDAEGNPLFSSDVNLTVKVSDTMSGIREIRYSITSENDTQNERSVVIGNAGNSVGQDLGDGWIITAMDENLVTEVIRNYTFSADNNNIQLSFGMTDRANNDSSKDSDVFSVDQTAPIINVVFDNPDGNGEYYRGERTATITVQERNFDSAKIIPSIQNEFGGTPTISSFTDSSNTEHIATITFREGDYTFDIDGTDRCGHTATVNYSGGNERSFRVDLTDPTLVNNFDQFINDAQNSFNVDKEMTLTITEHNFVPDMVAIYVYRTEAGKELTTATREECTTDYISADKWKSTGDTHTISFTFSADYVYQVVVGGTDASGRIIADSQSPVFEIDKTKPVLKTPKNLDVLVYTIKNTETEAASIVFDDSNIDRVDYTIVSYRMKLNEDNVGYDMETDSDSFSSANETVKINNEFFNQDGIYEVKCVPYDIAGNAGDETTHTYVIQRDTDFLVYIPNSNKEKHTGLYKFDEIGIRSADFEDIEIISYVTKDKAFSVEVDGTEIVDDDLNVTLDDRRINQVDMYDVTLKNSYIAQNFSEDTVDTDLTLNAVAKCDDSEQVITLGHIYIDNVKPVGEYEKSLQDIGFFDGYYGVNNKKVMIEGVSPDIDLSRCEIQANDTTLTYESEGFDYDADAHTISFTINKGYTDIRPTLVDNAGNVNNLAMIKHVYVGNLFARWWYLFIVCGLIILAIPTFIILAIVRKKERHKYS